ncbi:DUF805 domain-containing protein [Flavobacterium sp. GCM10027622]|uniref:DUF805 domain-containing protein n=1 Tax=unclassified Flavobacterium TaxID=196869 RepID=UPI0036246641
MNVFDWYKEVVFNNYVNFNGRARRKEYWYFTLVHVSIMILVVLIGGVLSGGKEPNGFFVALLGVYLLLTFIPSVAVTIRRLHDVNVSGWFYLINIIPYVGAFILFVFACTNGITGTNRYGPDPKKPIDEIDEIGQEQ